MDARWAADPRLQCRTAAADVHTRHQHPTRSTPKTYGTALSLPGRLSTWPAWGCAPAAATPTQMSTSGNRPTCACGDALQHLALQRPLPAAQQRAVLDQLDAVIVVLVVESGGGGVEGQEGGSGDDSFWLVLSGAAALFQGWTTGHVSQPPSSNRTPGSACTHPAAVRHGGGLPHAAQQGGELCAEGSGRGGSPGAGALGEEQW